MNFLIFGGTGYLGRSLIVDIVCRGHSAIAPGRSSLDLARDDSLFFQSDAIKRLGPYDLAVNCAAVCGGIDANSYSPYVFGLDNLLIGANFLRLFTEFGVESENILNIGTTCSYPLNAPIPLKEEYLHDGYPEPTNAHYGIAKRAVVDLCQSAYKQLGTNVTSLILANLYGPIPPIRDTSRDHAIPALIDKALADKTYPVYGDGSHTRDFLHIDDAIDAIKLAARFGNGGEVYNVGSGSETSIGQICDVITQCTGSTAIFGANGHTGQPRRLLDISKIREIGYSPKHNVIEDLPGIIDLYRQCKQ